MQKKATLTPPSKQLVTPEQYANAKTHWTKLWNKDVSGGFDMMSFTKLGCGQEYLHGNKNICNTVACSAGYLPETLQIPPDILQQYRMWDNSSRIDFDKLVAHFLGTDLNDNYHVWQWCFDSDWEYIDNTIQGAAIRLHLLFETGLPANWQRQMIGKESLSYDLTTYDIHFTS